MPLVKVNLRKGRTIEEKTAIADSIHAALVGALNVPEDDRYQLFTEFDDENFRHTEAYLGFTYSSQLLLIEITLLSRDDDLKKKLLAELNENLVAAGVARPDDVVVLITEIGRANISFGGGVAQRAVDVATR